MCVRICCMLVHKCIFLHMCMRVYVSTYMCMYMGVCTCIYACVHVCMLVSM